VLPDRTERRMFEEVLLGTRYALTADELATHFDPAIQSAARKISGNHRAEEWVEGHFTQGMTDALRDAAVPVAFGCGVEVLPPFQVDLQSASYQRQRQRALQQSLAEQQAAGRLEHVQRAAELLRQFQSLRAASPDLSPGRVLQQISAADRGAVLQTLLLASSKQQQGQKLWVVAGPYLVLIGVEDDRPPQPGLFPLPPTLGPTRSIAAINLNGQRRLLVGARSGLMLIDPANPAEAQLFSDSETQSPLGFNSIAYGGPSRGFFASHGDAGIVQWAPDRSNAPIATLRPDRIPGSEPMSSSDHADGPRNLRIFDEKSVVFSAGNRLLVTDMERIDALPMESAAEIVAIVPDDDRLLVIQEDGTLCGLDPRSRSMTCIGRRSMRVRSAGALPWIGASRLLLAGDEGPVQCIGFDDPLVSEYQSPHRGIRVLAGSSDMIAGVSADRQRLILWRSWDGRQPLSEIYLTGMTRHRIADITFA
jgi:hypothetical protein